MKLRCQTDAPAGPDPAGLSDISAKYWPSILSFAILYIHLWTTTDAVQWAWVCFVLAAQTDTRTMSTEYANQLINRQGFAALYTETGHS